MRETPSTYLLQNSSASLDVENKMIEDLLRKYKYTFDYKTGPAYDLTYLADKTSIPIGDIDFVTTCLNRVYVLGGEIEHISCYDGDCTILPDIELIKKAVNLINYNEKWLRSYTIDVMVGRQGTAIIEVHNFASVGLYSTLWDISLIYAYRDGIDYLLNDNKALKI